MLFWGVTVCIWLSETGATEKPVYQTVQHHIAEDHYLEIFLSLYLVIPTRCKVASTTGKHTLAYHCMVICRKYLG